MDEDGLPTSELRTKNEGSVFYATEVRPPGNRQARLFCALPTELRDHAVTAGLEPATPELPKYPHPTPPASPRRSEEDALIARDVALRNIKLQRALPYPFTHTT